jgi:hypothetical protein
MDSSIDLSFNGIKRVKLQAADMVPVDHPNDHNFSPKLNEFRRQVTNDFHQEA